MPQPGVTQNPYARVPSSPSLYSNYMNQYYPGWQEKAMGGAAYPVEPGQFDPNNPVSSLGGYKGQFQASDPRNIAQDPAFMQLMQLIGAGSSGPGTAAKTMGPALEYLKGAIQNPNPLGTGRGELVKQQGLEAIDTAGSTARRNIGEASTTFGRAADPEATAFSQGMTRVAQAKAYGPGAIAPGKQVELAEKQANESFRAAMADVLKNAGLGLGGLENQAFATQMGGAGQASQIMSFAYNTWSELLARLLGGGGPIQYSVEQRGAQRELDSNFLRNPVTGQNFPNSTNPFPEP